MKSATPITAFLQLSPRGQLTLPVEIRREVGIEGGDPLVVSVKDGTIVLTPAVVTPIERYTDERVAEFAEAAEMSAEEIAQARTKWRL
jgi:antitoxin PrlF